MVNVAVRWSMSMFNVDWSMWIVDGQCHCSMVNVNVDWSMSMWNGQCRWSIVNGQCQ